MVDFLQPVKERSCRIHVFGVCSMIERTALYGAISLKRTHVCKKISRGIYNIKFIFRTFSLPFCVCP